MNTRSAYEAAKAKAKMIRVVVLIPPAELEAIDEWAVPAEQPSRTAAIRGLIKLGLSAATAASAKPIA